MPNSHANGPSENAAGATGAESAGGEPLVPLQLVLYPNGAAINIDRTDLVIGRHAGSGLRLHLPDVSRRHCRLLFDDGQWQVLDLHSTNGVFLNDARVERAALRHRDLVRIGSYTFEVHLGHEHQPSATADRTQSEGSQAPHRKAS